MKRWWCAREPRQRTWVDRRQLWEAPVEDGGHVACGSAVASAGGRLGSRRRDWRRRPATTDVPCKVNVATLQKAAVDHWSEPGAYRRQLIIHDRAVDRTLSEYQHCETPDLSIAASRLNVAVCWTPSAKPTAMQPGSAVQSASRSASFVLRVTRSSSAS
jgi:hypothetical protein